MLPLDKLEALSRRFREVEALLCTQAVLEDPAESRRLHEEHAQLSRLVDAFEAFGRVERDLADSDQALADPELRALAEAERPSLEQKRRALEDELRFLLLPKDPRDRKSVILEIRGGEGGEEACLFAADLFRMITRYAEARRYKVEVLSTSEAAAGGYKEIISLVSGEGAFSELRWEAGVHRVQRVPATETQGRVHTSTASVIVLPEADDVDVVLDEKDLEIHIAASGGPGGQGVNTTNSAVQIQHKPSGLIVKCQDERSQIKNKAKALRILKSRLLDLERERREQELASERKGMVKSADRAQKIRTYNYPQNRVTDHRIGLTLHKLDRVVEGDLGELVAALRADHQASLLAAEAAGDARG